MSAIVSFILFGIIGCFELGSYIEYNQRIPGIIVSTISSEKKYAPTNMGQIIGMGPSYTIEGDSQKENHTTSIFPYLHIQLLLLNPSDRSTTFMQCKLNANFSHYKTREKPKNLTSDGYVEVDDYLLGNRESGNSHYYLQSGEAHITNLMFFFIPLPEVLEIWESESQTLDINSVKVNCKNEFNEIIQSQ